MVDYGSLIKAPWISSAYLLLILTTLSFWITKKRVVWGSLIILAVINAWLVGIVSIVGIIGIGLLASLHFINVQPMGTRLKWAVIGLITFLSLCLIMHQMPGFTNLAFAQHVVVKPLSLPYTLFMNFDKSFVGLFALGLSLPLMKNFQGIKRLSIITGSVTLGAIIIMYVLGSSLGMLAFEPGWPKLIWIWSVCNLFFVVIPEEVFFRGFLQREITDLLPKKWGFIVSILVSALLFSFIHLIFIANMSYIIFTFALGLIWSILYHYTEVIETVIASHFLFNLIHFIFFSYPLLYKGA